ncbi:hypothetical protein AX16_006349 [Volvariella volvacea WC 439]|nr:hypothetical protein AX16_006349 [Volvariella volvacea WC 439]
MSVNVLRIEAHLHDYLDDLQSFFYVLAWICIAYDGPGQRKSTLPQILRAWSTLSRCSFFVDKSAHHMEFEQHFAQNVSPYFGDVFVSLLRNLHNIFWQVDQKATFAAPRPGHDYNPEEVYDRYLAAIDVALSALQPDSIKSITASAIDHPTKVLVLPRSKSEKRKRSVEQDEIGDLPWKNRIESS